MGAPLLALRQQLTAESYAMAYAMWEGHLSLMHSRSVQVALCLAIALLLIACIPIMQHLTGDWFGAAALSVLSIAAAFYFWRMHPAAMIQKGRNLYDRTPLLHGFHTHTLYADRIESQSEDEWMCQYYTDFDQCLEGAGLFVLCGGPERGLIVLDKAQMRKDECETVRDCLKNAFAARYWRLGSSGGVE